MHFFYIDESWCTLKDLNNSEQPIFVLWWLIVRDEWWNKTKEEFEKIIINYFDWEIPDNFELHSKDLFSPRWEGFFNNHSREKRTLLINKILDLIIDRKHQIYYHWIDKKRLNEYDLIWIKKKDYLDLKNPYCISYDYLITLVNNHTKIKLWKSARALIILDEKDSLKEEIKSITEFRRYKNIKKDLIKWIAEFSYSIDSKKNVMIQISDFIVYVIKKYLEIENWYRETYPPNIKNIYRDFYKKIDQKLITKTLHKEDNQNIIKYNDFLDNISSFPSKRWKSKAYWT